MAWKRLIVEKCINQSCEGSRTKKKARISKSIEIGRKNGKLTKKKIKRGRVEKDEAEVISR